MESPEKPAAPPASRSFRETLQFYLIDCKTPLGKFIDIVIIFLNLVICAIFVADTYDLSPATERFLWRLEVVIVFFFIIEYIARLYAADNRWRQLFDIYSIIDLIAIIPTVSLLLLPLVGITPEVGFIKVIRILRIFRIFRFLRFAADAEFFFGEITHHILNVLRFFLTLLFLFFISSGAFYHVEHTANPEINSFGDAFYFTVVTLTTVGFGDITPSTQAGKWVTVVMILSGIILVPWQATRIVKVWMRIAGKQDVVCPKCGLRYHDRDASHCKSCGEVIFQPYDDESF